MENTTQGKVSAVFFRTSQVNFDLLFCVGRISNIIAVAMDPECEAYKQTETIVSLHYPKNTRWSVTKYDFALHNDKSAMLHIAMNA